MKYANLTLPSKKLCFVMALAAGTLSFPMSAMAEPAVQATQQSGILKGQVVDKQVGAAPETVFIQKLEKSK